MSHDFVGDVWVIVEYEVKMLFATTAMVLDKVSFEAMERPVKNALIESAVLHSRILSDVLLSKGKSRDDITLEDIVPGWSSRPDCGVLREALDRLKVAYGDWKAEGKPCWVFNKMAAHPTKHRGNSYDYDGVLADMVVLLRGVVEQVEAILGRSFMLTFRRP